MLKRLRVVLSSLVRRSRFERDMADELRSHLEMRVDTLVASGLAPGAARRHARLEFGSLEAYKDTCRDVRGLTVVDDVRQDVRYACRSFVKNPGFTAIAVLTLALGIGANTAIFSVFDTALLRPLPFHEADRLYVIHEGRRSPVNALHFREWRAATRSFEHMALIGPASYTLTGIGDAVRVNAGRATPDLFPTLGVQPVLGRGFRDEEDAPGRDGVVILAHELWTTRFGADRNVIGRTITLDDEPHVIVGVLPADFGLPQMNHLYALAVGDVERPQLWKPFAATPRDLRLLGSFNYIAIARLKPDVSAAQALDDLNAVQAALARSAPERAEFRAVIVPMADQVGGRSKAALQLVLGAVTLVLLIACVNITNLLLARGGRRQREFAIRRAAGASRRRLVMQMIVESLVLASFAGLLGLAIGAWLVRLIQVNAPVGLPRIDEAALDLRGMFFTVAVTLGSGLLIGLLPAWRSTHAPSIDLLRSSSATASSGRAFGRLRSLLVGVEVAASAVCLIAGAWLLSSFVNLLSVERGFDTDRIVTVSIPLPNARYDAPEKGLRFVNDLAGRVRSMPGVVSVGATDVFPLSGPSSSAIMIEGTSLPRQQRPSAAIRAADAGYFRTLGIPLQAGRLIEDRDAGRRVAVVSAMTARRLWPEQDPIGKRFRHGPDDSPLIEVVGVVGDVRAVSLSENPPLNIYRPTADYFFNQVRLAVKTTSDPATLSGAIRAAVKDLDSALPAPTPRTMDDIVAASVVQRRFQMNLMLLLAAAAAFLAALGIYGVVSQVVTQRTSEFGIRMALGANGGNIRRLVLRQGLLPVVIGLAAGIIASLGAGRLLQSLLFRVSPSDIAPFAVASLFLLSIALLSSFIPAWRASRIDPIRALRYE